MAVDHGITSGVKYLWVNNYLCDFTLVAEGREVHAHRVVLAAVSGYFEAMLCQPFKESTSDRVELKGINHSVLDKILEFVYTGEQCFDDSNTLDIFKCAVYLQMPTVSKFCAKRLIEHIELGTCLDLLGALAEGSFVNEAQCVRAFIKSNWKQVLQKTDLAELSFQALMALIENWEKSEWDKFLFVNSWYSADPESRKDCLNSLMNYIRFCLIPSQEVEAICTMLIFNNSKSTWKELVENARLYHKMPGHLKVLDRSLQAKVRTNPRPVFFTCAKDGTSMFYALDDKAKWEKHRKVENGPIFTGPSHTAPIPHCVEVNNFLVVFANTQDPHSTEWAIFDPRTQVWSEMAGMNRRTVGFVLVEHKEYLYAVGGVYKPDRTKTSSQEPSYEVERYNFRTNEWSPAMKMPFATREHGACCFKDILYICGGLTQKHKNSRFKRTLRMDSFDLSSMCNDWERKAPYAEDDSGHRTHHMGVGAIKGKDVVIDVDSHFGIFYYTPNIDQWAKFEAPGNPEYSRAIFCNATTLLYAGNSFCFLKVRLRQLHDSDSSDSDDSFDSFTEGCHSLLWRASRSRSIIFDTPIEKYPAGNYTPFGAFLSLPY